MREREDSVQKLPDIVNPDNPVEIGVQVYQLKERETTSICTPSSAPCCRLPHAGGVVWIGRGLRLPYGHRTGSEDLAKLTIVANNPFQESDLATLPGVTAQGADPRPSPAAAPGQDHRYPQDHSHPKILGLRFRRLQTGPELHPRNLIDFDDIDYMTTLGGQLVAHLRSYLGR